MNCATRAAKQTFSSVKAQLYLSIVYCLLVLYSMFILMPLLITFTSSLRTTGEIFKYLSPFSWRTLFPTKVTLASYIELFEKYSFGRALGNSVFVSLVTVLVGLLVNGMAGFALAQFRFWGRNILFILVLISFMVPFEALAIPLYGLIRKMGLENSYSALILPSAVNGMVIFLFRQFFKGFPRTLFEAALVDGASWYTIFFRIVLPLSRPVLTSAGILLLITQWNAFFYPLLVANVPRCRVVQVAVANLFTQYGTEWGLVFAAVSISAVIPILIFLPFQRYYIASITSAGIKE